MKSSEEYVWTSLIPALHMGNNNCAFWGGEGKYYFVNFTYSQDDAKHCKRENSTEIIRMEIENNVLKLAFTFKLLGISTSVWKYTLIRFEMDWIYNMLLQ